jgi:hypothetical protein
MGRTVRGDRLVIVTTSLTPSDVPSAIPNGAGRGTLVNASTSLGSVKKR